MEERKKDHLSLALQAQLPISQNDSRFCYEPMLAAHPVGMSSPIQFLGKELAVPFWVSSMTGGTSVAKTINQNLARACSEFGMGMGLGSCRILLDDAQHLADFDVRDILGSHLPFYANIGICQLEELLERNELDRLTEVVTRLRADGLIVHVNPLQEWFQAEGDRIKRPPIETIAQLLEMVGYPIIVKEVGQGMGYQSLNALLNLPLAAVEFAAFGGTNFSKMEMLRANSPEDDAFAGFAAVGHSAPDMVAMANDMVLNGAVRCNQLIISGGIESFLDGYYLLSKSSLPAVVGMASAFLKYAQDYDMLKRFVIAQVRGFRMAQAYLTVRE
jgi:isopentenyl-diphosphate Delta-isomerase